MKKGFTITELLALLALVSTPFMISVFGIRNGLSTKSKKDAVESSMLSYTQATENTILINLMNSSTSVSYDSTYSVNGLTLTSATIDSKGKVTTILPCLNNKSKPVAFAAGEKCGKETTNNPKYIKFNIDLKGDQPDVNDGNYIKVDDNIVVEAKLKFSGYYVSYFYDIKTGTTKYCSDDNKFITDKEKCNSE